MFWTPQKVPKKPTAPEAAADAAPLRPLTEEELEEPRAAEKKLFYEGFCRFL